MKKIILLLAFALTSSWLAAQAASSEVIASAGDQFSNPGSSVAWTLGEPVTETFSGASMVTQGFHQTEIFVTALEETAALDFGVEVFPNPVSELLHVRWTDSPKPMDLELVNLAGQVLMKRHVANSSHADFRVDGLPDGQYLLKVVQESGSSARTFKVSVIR